MPPSRPAQVKNLFMVSSGFATNSCIFPSVFFKKTKIFLKAIFGNKSASDHRNRNYTKT